MIVKSVEMNNAQKSSIHRLANYLMTTQGKDERLEYVWATNCQDDLEAHINETVTDLVMDEIKSRIDWNIEDIKNVQALNTRTTKDKTYHLVISFREGERKLGIDDLKKIENELLSGLGFEERQRICVAHRDTDNVHFHIALNKIHPQNYNTHNPYMDFKKLQKTAERLEKEFGLLPDNHETKKTLSAARINNMEHGGDMQSLASWLKENCLEQLQKADTWASIHNVLSEHNIEILKKGAGLVFKDKNSDIAVKASTVSRELSFKKLENKLGEYQAAALIQPEPKKQYEKKPLGQTDTKKGNLWQDFKTALESRKQAVNNNLQQINNAYSTAKIEIRANANKTFEFIKISDMGNQASARAEVAARRETILTQAREEYLSKKANLYEQNKPLKWLPWLTEQAQKGNNDALAYLSKRMFTSQINDILEQVQGQDATGHFLHDRQYKTITKKGTVLHSKNVKETLDAIKLNNAGFWERQKALNLAVQKFGNTLTLSGSKKFQEEMVRAAVEGKIDCTFTNKDMEQYRQKLLTDKKEAYSQKTTTGAQAFSDEKTIIAGNYINDRNALVGKVKSLQTHVLYSSQSSFTGEYVGMRNKDGVYMALVRLEQQIVVIPLNNEKAANKISAAFKVGEKIKVDKGLVTKPKQVSETKIQEDTKHRKSGR